MEEAYRTVGLAISRLVSETGEEIEHLKNQTVLRSVLQLRPVILGYALSTLARRLKDSEFMKCERYCCNTAAVTYRVSHHHHTLL